MSRRLHPSDPRLSEPDFPHGTEAGYDRGCSCDECRSARSAAVAARRAARSGNPEAYGQRGLIDAGPAARHLAWLLQTGTLSEVSRAARVPYATLANLLARAGGSGIKIKPETAAAIRRTSPLDVVAAQASSAEPVRRHVVRLTRPEGCTPVAVARAAGVASSTVFGILAGSRSNLQEATITAIMNATQEDVLAAAGYVSPACATTRLGALQANGWSYQRLSRMLGSEHLEMGSEWTTRTLDERIMALYEKVGDRPGGNQRVAEAARARGFYPPIHYDDDMTLLVDSIRNEVAEARAAKREKARESLRIMGFTIRGCSTAEIEKLTGATETAVEVARRRVGLKLNPHRRAGDSLMMPGQDELVALVADYLKPIDLHYPTDAFDEEDLDHADLWLRLGREAQSVRANMQQQQQSA